MISRELIGNVLRDIMMYTIYSRCQPVKMENYKLKIMTDQPWKNYKNDPKMERLFNSLEELKKKREQDDFKEWLKKRIYNEDENYLEIHEILNYMMEDVKEILKPHNYTILNEKWLRDRIASMIYRSSNE